ncbi:MAG: sulfur carrier protein ThiS [Candidatus Omnitrophica bacterium]|nr:sulfur carrier protein ThiS [Candidatus Omnitrophota bacterium]
MKIHINGKEEVIEDIKNLTDLIGSKKLKANNIVIEYNLKVVPREQWDRVALSEGDRLEIVSFVGGG